ncbi:MAG: SIS domain-containing protein, partial [Candidatus Woesearchaeota archaeon]
MISRIKELIDEHFAMKPLVEKNTKDIAAAASSIFDCYRKKGKVLIFGNGGSASDAEHFAAELVGRFEKERRALPAIALTANSSSATAIANDYGFESVFERQVEALCNKGDVAIGISTSGNSRNVIKALEKAKSLGASTMSLLGSSGGALRGKADVEILITEPNTARVQEAHILCIHIISKLVEDA